MKLIIVWKSFIMDLSHRYKDTDQATPCHLHTVFYKDQSLIWWYKLNEFLLLLLLLREYSIHRWKVAFILTSQWNISLHLSCFPNASNSQNTHKINPLCAFAIRFIQIRRITVLLGCLSVASILFRHHFLYGEFR